MLQHIQSLLRDYDDVTWVDLTRNTVGPINPRLAATPGAVRVRELYANPLIPKINHIYRSAVGLAWCHGQNLTENLEKISR
jgi:hypothetical protein